MTRIAVVPYPPLLVPELTVRAGAETERLRTACLRAVLSLTDSARKWVVVGVDRYGPRRLDSHTVGTFAGYGVDVGVALGRSAPDMGSPDPLLPLPALTAGWLREQAGADEVSAHLLADGTTPGDSRALGARLARSANSEPFGLLVMADGAAPRTGAPGSRPDSAEYVDEEIRRALADVDLARLCGLTPELCARAGLEARAALQALAGAVEAVPGTWCGDLLYSGAPYGVGYHVAVWSRTDTRGL